MTSLSLISPTLECDDKVLTSGVTRVSTPMRVQPPPAPPVLSASSYWGEGSPAEAPELQPQPVAQNPPTALGDPGHPMWQLLAGSTAGAPPGSWLEWGSVCSPQQLGGSERGDSAPITPITHPPPPLAFRARAG